LSSDDVVSPFRVTVSDADVADLRERLARTRWPEPATTAGWEQGTPLAYARALCEHWRSEYDFAAAEKRLNQFPQFMTSVDGLDVHFVHVSSPVPSAIPLVITHGWPGSVVEFWKVIGPLTDPAAHGLEPDLAFHVVCPSLPGYGFSGKPSGPGWGVERTADAWDVLMRRLGYARYGAQGGDWGAGVTTCLGRQHPDSVLGIHLNMVIAPPPREALRDPASLSPRERDALLALARYRDEDSGYSKQQSTRPQSVGYGLVDSPAALCAWITEKLWSWSDCDGDPASAFTREEMLDDIMLYWLPAAGASSARLYWESFGKRDNSTVPVPAGCSVFPKDIFRPTRAWAEPLLSDLRYWNEPDRGGHFAAWEQPELFVGEVRAAFRSFGV
jgi:pimeloyl-ACP methyl ester carboxylesterase